MQVKCFDSAWHIVSAQIILAMTTSPVINAKLGVLGRRLIKIEVR